MLASGLPLLTATDVTKWGFYVLPWIVIVLVPFFLLFSVVLAVLEVYYDITTTSANGKRFRRLLDSLSLPSECRTPTDIGTILKTISASEFLQAYPYLQLSQLCRTCELLELKSGEAVFREGEVGHHFFVLINGTVDVYVSDKSARSPLQRNYSMGPFQRSSLPQLKCVNSLHDSGGFGELALLQVSQSFTEPACEGVADSLSLRQIGWFCFQAGGRRTASIICRTACKLISIHRDAFQKMLTTESYDAGPATPNAKQPGSDRKVGREISVRQASVQEVIAGLEIEKRRKSQKKLRRLAAFLKSSFAKSMKSRSDVSSSSYRPGTLSVQLLERAVAARSTVNAWCKLVNMEAPAVVKAPVPGKLTEMQARNPHHTYHVVRDIIYIFSHAFLFSRYPRISVRPSY